MGISQQFKHSAVSMDTWPTNDATELYRMLESEKDQILSLQPNTYTAAGNHIYFDKTSHTLSKWIELLTNDTSRLPENCQKPLHEVRQHLESLAENFIKKTKDPLHWAINVSIFATIAPILPFEKLQLAKTSSFFEAFLSEQRDSIKPMMEIAALGLATNLVSRMPHHELPTGLFCALAAFLLDIQGSHVSENTPLVRQFLNPLNWPQTLSLSTQTARVLSTLGDMLDNPLNGYDFSTTFCFGILPRLTPAARLEFQSGSIIPEEHYLYLADLDIVFAAGLIQVIRPTYPLIGHILIKALAQFDQLSINFGNNLDLAIAKNIINTPPDVLRKVRVTNAQNSPLIRFCVDRTCPDESQIPATISGKLAVELAVTFLEKTQHLPSVLGKAFHANADDAREHKARIQSLYEAYPGQAAPYIQPQQFAKACRKIQDLEKTLRTLQHMIMHCDERTLAAHSAAIASIGLAQEASFHLLMSGEPFTRHLLPLAVDHGSRQESTLYDLIEKLMSLHQTYHSDVQKQLPTLCKAWLEFSGSTPTNIGIGDLLTTHIAQTPNIWVAITSIITGVSIPNDIALKVVKDCYRMTTDNKAIIVGQTTVVVDTAPESSHKLSPELWTRLTFIATENTQLGNMALNNLIKSADCRPETLVYLEETAKHSANKITQHRYLHILQEIFRHFSPKTHRDMLQKLCKHLPKSSPNDIVNSAIQSTKPLAYLRAAFMVREHDTPLLESVLVHETLDIDIKAKIMDDYCTNWLQKNETRGKHLILPELINLLTKRREHYTFSTKNPYLDLIPRQIWELINTLLQDHTTPGFSKAVNVALLRPEKIDPAIYEKYPFLKPDNV
jgi:hypothetical protein